MINPITQEVPSNVQGGIITASDGTQYRTVGQPVTISSVPISQVGVPLTEGVPITSSTVTTTQQARREIPQNIPVTTSAVYTQPLTRTSVTQQQGMVNQPVIEGVSEIQQPDEHLKDSVQLGRPTESPEQLKVEGQQMQLSQMRYESHQTFENWEANRNLFVNDRLNVMDDLLASMDKKLDWLELGVQKAILFFKEREAQEIEYSRKIKHGLTQLGDHFEKGDNPGFVSDFSRGMKENDAFHAKDKQNSEILGNFIKKDILDWILLPSEKEYKLQEASLKAPVLATRKKFDSIAAKRATLYSKYFKMYDNLLKHPTKPSPKENGIFKRQLKYSLAAREELRILRLYGEQGLMVITEFTRLATVRMGEIQRAFSLYLQKYTELYKNSATTPEPVLEMIEKANGPESIQNMFSVRSLLSFANYEYLRKELGKDDITYPDLQPFLVNFPDSIDPARSSFVVREWEAVKSGGFLKKPKACNIVATKGNTLLIIEKKHEEQEIGKVNDPYLMRYTKVENIVEGADGTSLKIVERVPGSLFIHTHKVKLKFETQDEAQSFMSFMNSMNAQLQGSQVAGEV